jgi:hypothetical protein
LDPEPLPERRGDAGDEQRGERDGERACVDVVDVGVESNRPEQPLDVQADGAEELARHALPGRQRFARRADDLAERVPAQQAVYREGEQGAGPAAQPIICRPASNPPRQTVAQEHERIERDGDFLGAQRRQRTDSGQRRPAPRSDRPPVHDEGAEQEPGGEHVGAARRPGDRFGVDRVQREQRSCSECAGLHCPRPGIPPSRAPLRRRRGRRGAALDRESHCKELQREDVHEHRGDAVGEHDREVKGEGIPAAGGAVEQVRRDGERPVVVGAELGMSRGGARTSPRLRKTTSCRVRMIGSSQTKPLRRLLA